MANYRVFNSETTPIYARIFVQDQTGNWVPMEVNGFSSQVVVSDYYLGIGRGDISVYKHGILNGFRPNLTKASFLPLNGGVVAEEQIPAELKIVSTSAEDSASGLGVQKVKICYLDDDYNILEHLVDLSGQTPVIINLPALRHLEGFEAVQVGSLGGASGTIVLSDLEGTNNYAQISPGKTLWPHSHLHVPAGHKLFIYKVGLYAYDADIEFLLYREENYAPEGGVVLKEIWQSYLAKGSFLVDFPVPIVVEEKRKIELKARSYIATFAQAGCNIFYWIE